MEPAQEEIIQCKEHPKPKLDKDCALLAAAVPLPRRISRLCQKIRTKRVKSYQSLMIFIKLEH